VAATTQDYYRWNPMTDGVFMRLPEQAERWNVPLLLGEFGAFAKTGNVRQYMDHQYELLDRVFASATQWNYTPDWTPEKKDGWNDEDYSIVDDRGRLRPNFQIRPHPRKVAGLPGRFLVRRSRAGGVLSVELSWYNLPDTGKTEIFLPLAQLFYRGNFRIDTLGEKLSCAHDPQTNVLTCSSPLEGDVQVRVHTR
jgi:hypothetical protein